MLLVLTLYLLSKIEVLDLIARTKNSSWIDASLELLSNQSVLNTNAWILLVKLITYKNIGITYISKVVNRAEDQRFRFRLVALITIPLCSTSSTKWTWLKHIAEGPGPSEAVI